MFRSKSLYDKDNIYNNDHWQEPSLQCADLILGELNRIAQRLEQKVRSYHVKLT